jgi:hypothetical protein
MAETPHDVVDLFLAPVALALEERLVQLGQLSLEDLGRLVALESPGPDRTRTDREKALLRTITYLIELHGWSAEWDPRGLRMSHGGRSLVLGVPALLADYCAGAPLPHGASAS